MISKGCTYGIQVTVYLAARAGNHVPVRMISDELGVPHSFLAKVVSMLARAGILDTMRGPTGGVSLARGSDEISVREIIAAIDGTQLFTECVLGLPGCGHEQPCPFHHQWGGIRDGLESTFEAIAVCDLIQSHPTGLPLAGSAMMNARP